MKATFVCAIIAIIIKAANAAAAVETCESGAWKCSDDAYTLTRCESGAWTQVECMRSEGKLCENGACVDPWKYGSPAWKTPPADPLATPETLAEKAAYFEESARRLHVHPQLKWMAGVNLPCKPVKCAEGRKEPCLDCTEPAIPEEKATWRDVEKWHSGENDGLFGASLYLAAEAFRYGATRDPEALEMVKLLMDGEVTRMRITGVPGNFTRQYIPPGIDGLTCPVNPVEYSRSPKHDLNTWVKIGEDGCAWYVDGATKEWKASDHCGFMEYAGWCWLDNVSKDEYSGHMFALGVVAKLVNDPQVQATAKDLLSQVANLLMSHKMEIIDWDGTVTPFGRMHAVAMDDYLGFNAAMALDFIKLAAETSGDPKIMDWYDNCLLQKKGKRNCLGSPLEMPKDYSEYLPHNGLYTGHEGCLMNYNNNSMHLLSLNNLIWYEHDPELREIYQKTLDEDVFRPKNQVRALMYHNNAFFDFIFASQKRLGPGSDGPAYDAVENGVAMLRQLPARRHFEDVACPPEKSQPYCKNRFGDYMGQFPRTAGERCPGVFMWWRDPYDLDTCKMNRRTIMPPVDFLLPYWMGRYYGFITEGM